MGDYPDRIECTELATRLRILIDKAVVHLKEETGKAGCAVVLMHLEHPNRIERLIAGESHENIEVYLYHALEKAARLRVNHVVKGHTTSMESQDESGDRWGGAIVVGDWIVSVSGYSPTRDQAIALWATEKAEMVQAGDPILEDD